MPKKELKALKKVTKKKNRSIKIVNNHKIKIYHKSRANRHTINKDIGEIYKDLCPIYQELENDFMPVDMIDLIFYERWLNG